jgi:histidinol-phosphate aminotransferase
VAGPAEPGAPAVQRQQPGLAAAAAALDDAGFLAESKAVNDAGMAQLIEGFKRWAWTGFPPPAISSAVQVAPDGDAGPVFQALLRKGVIVRPVGNYGMAEYLRVSIGLPEQNARFLSALGEILEAK